MTKRSFALIAGALAAVAAAAPAHAQIPSFTPFSFEVRGGVAVPTGDFNEDAGAAPGLALSGTVTYHALPMIGIYGGFTYNRFGVDDDLAEIVGDGQFVETGVDVGARLAIPTPLIPIDPWIRAGVLFHKLGGDGFEDDDFNADGDTGFGYEVGAGLGFGFGPVSLTPGVSFVSYDVEGADASATYFRADVGVRIRL